MLWITVLKIPTHYKKDESYRSIGQALGEVDKVDVDNGRVRVYINIDEHLQFERKAGYANGYVIKVILKYKELHRYFFTCKRILHEEGTCPMLTLDQREANRLTRLEQKEKEEVAAREAFSVLLKGFEGKSHFDNQERIHRLPISPRMKNELPIRRAERGEIDHSRTTEHGDLRHRIPSNRENQGKDVWKRLDHHPTGRTPETRRDIILLADSLVKTQKPREEALRALISERTTGE